MRHRRFVATTLVLFLWLTGAVAPLRAADPPAPPPVAPEPTIAPKVVAPNSTPAATAPAPLNDPVYAVSKFDLRYLRNHPKLPKLKDVAELEITLSEATDGFTAANPDLPTKKMRLKDVADLTDAHFHASAIQKILEALRDYFTSRDYMGVYVAPDPFEIDEHGNDVRKAGQTSLHLVITVGMVTEVRTLASGERVDPEQRVNNPAHDRIRRQSPIQPYRRSNPDRQDLLRKDELDDYAYWLSRHPGRRADVALSSGVAPGSVALDYLITENKPWTVFAQVSNTGTSETSDWRERFGFFHNQLTGNDDILSIDYVTAGFEQTNTVSMFYDAPVAESKWWRWRVYGSWSEFTASDVGFANDTFTGEDWSAGAEISATVFQHHDLFVDVFAGARYDDTQVDNTLPGDNRGHEQFLLPHVGARVDQAAEWFTNHASVTFEWTDGGITGVSQDQMDKLGRGVGADESWAVLQWDISHSVYLEPLLDHKAWLDPSSGKATLAHELYFGFRGQYGFDNRLIPHAEETVGGLYSVRGYPEAAVAGDTVLIASAEYRYHVPRAFAITPEPGKLFNQTFRYAPQYPYGLPDWDLILRGFVDVGEAFSNGGQDFSDSESTLVSTGVGAELLFKRNVSLRVDWGIALKDLPDRNLDAGSNRFHFLFTVLY